MRGAPSRRGLFVVTRGRRKRLKRSDIFFPMQPPSDEPLGPQGSTEAVEAVEGGSAGQHLSPPTDEASDDLAAAALDAATAAAAANVDAGSRKGGLCRCGCAACGDPYAGASRASHMSAAAPALRDGDIVGCFVHLPGRPPATLEDPRGRPSLWRFLQQGEKQFRGKRKWVVAVRLVRYLLFTDIVGLCRLFLGLMSLLVGSRAS